jgi:DNA-binding IclR family transcriptional regulator
MPTSPARTSPPTERVVAVLDFLARHPNDRFGVSELARRLGLSKPTCLGIVSALTEADYLARDGAHKTYRLGPALISLGRTAQESMRVDPAAREELHRLSTAFGTTAALSAVIDDRITLLELVGPPGTDARGPAGRSEATRESVRVGQSYPFAPPVGLMYVLWDDAALQAWLAKEPTVPLPTDSARLNRVIAECRSCGYLVERLTPAGRRLYALMAGMSNTLPDELRALLGELVADLGERVYLRSETAGQRRGTRSEVSVISAPVYDQHRRQAMVASLHIGRTLTDAEIGKRARALVTTADVLTNRLGGVKPQR